MKPEFRQLRLSQLDRNLELARSLPPRPSGGWIASVREALGLSQRQVGKKMRASGQAIQQFEKAPYIRELHHRMFDNVWKWAGTYRKTERNIGCDPQEIVQRIPQCLDNTRYWLENKTFSNDKALLRFHHQLTKIHPFANGNGRHARMIADVVAVKNGQAEFT